MEAASPLQPGVDFTLFQSADALIAAAGGLAAGWLAQHMGYGACLASAALLCAGGAWALAGRAPYQEKKRIQKTQKQP